MWLFLNVITLIKFYVIIFYTIFQRRCFNIQNGLCILFSKDTDVRVFKRSLFEHP